MQSWRDRGGQRGDFDGFVLSFCRQARTHTLKNAPAPAPSSSSSSTRTHQTGTRPRSRRRGGNSDDAVQQEDEAREREREASVLEHVAGGVLSCAPTIVNTHSLGEIAVVRTALERRRSKWKAGSSARALLCSTLLSCAPPIESSSARRLEEFIQLG
jgi:hypothetical protein